MSTIMTNKYMWIETIDIPATLSEEMDPKDYVTRVFVGFFRWPIDSG